MEWMAFCLVCGQRLNQHAKEHNEVYRVARKHYFRRKKTHVDMML